MDNQKTPFRRKIANEENASRTPKRKASLSRMRRAETLTAWLFLAPAAVGLILFMIVPFFMAFYLSLTDARLLRQEPPQFTGLDNYQQLLGMRIIPVDPELDGSGAPLVDEEGKVVYPVRDILRGEDLIDLRLKEVFQFDLFDQHYLLVARDVVFLRALANNFYFAIVVVPLQTAFALLLAVLVNQKLPGINFFRGLYFIPVVTSMVVVAVIWTFLYNPGEGLINSFIESVTFGLIGPQEWLQNPKLAFPAIMVLSIWQGVGFQMVIFLAGLQEIPAEIYEAASIDGANKLQEFFFITIPQLKNTIIFVVIATTILAFQLFTQVQVMTGGGPSNATITTVLHAYQQGLRENRIGYASAITVIFFLIVVAISLIQRKLVREERAVK